MGEKPAKHWLKTVKFGSLLAAIFLNISAENFTSMLFKSNATGMMQ